MRAPSVRSASRRDARPLLRRVLSLIRVRACFLQSSHASVSALGSRGLGFSHITSVFLFILCSVLMAGKKKPTKAEQEAQIAALQARLAQLEGSEVVAAKPITKKAGKDGKGVKEEEEKKPRAPPALEYVPSFSLLCFL